MAKARKAFAKVAEIDPVAARLAKPGSKVVRSRKRAVRGTMAPRQAQSKALEMQVWGLVAEGRTIGAIVRELNLTAAGVRGIIKRVEQRYQQITVASVGEMKARQTRLLEKIAEEAMSAWEKSKSPKRRVETQKGTIAGAKGEADIDVTKKAVEVQFGDARFLSEARSALADIRDIYGLNAPKVVEVDNGPMLISFEGEEESPETQDAEEKRAVAAAKPALPFADDEAEPPEEALPADLRDSDLDPDTVMDGAEADFAD